MPNTTKTSAACGTSSCSGSRVAAKVSTTAMVSPSLVCGSRAGATEPVIPANPRPGRSTSPMPDDGATASANNHGLMTNDQHYDVAIIGTGAGGGTLGHRLAMSGKRVLWLER